jgi:quinol monooxygenase YgiN
MITVTISLNVWPEKRQEFIQTLRSLYREIMTCKGFKNSRLFQNMDHFNSFTIVQEWEEEQALDKFIKSDRFSVLLGALRVLGETAEIRYNLVYDAQRMEEIELA